MSLQDTSNPGVQRALQEDNTIKQQLSELLALLLPTRTRSARTTHAAWLPALPGDRAPLLTSCCLPLLGLLRCRVLEEFISLA